MRARIVSLATLTETDIALWTDLRDRALDPYPFLDPRMIVASVPHMPLARAMGVIFVEDNSKLLAVMPFTITKMESRLRLTIVSTRTEYLDDQGGWDHPLVDAARAEEAIDGLFVGMRSLRLPRLVQFANLPVGGPLEQALVATAARRRIVLLERGRREFVYAVRPPNEAEGGGAPSDGTVPPPSFTLAHFSPRLRKDLVRRAERLALELGAELRVEDRSGDPAAITEFVELQSSGWKGDVTRGGDGIRVRGDEAWFRDVTDRYRADGDLVVFALTAGDTVVHMRVSTRIADEVFGWFDAYDERFADYRPGLLGRVVSMNRILAVPGVRSFDPNFHPSTGDAKKIFPYQRDRATVLAANGGVLSRTVVHLLRVVRSVKLWAKSVVRGG